MPEVPDPSNAPVLIPVTVSVSFASESLSLVKTSLVDPLDAVKVVSIEILIVLLSLDATGASFPPVTENVIVAVSVAVPSDTV